MGRDAARARLGRGFEGGDAARARDLLGIGFDGGDAARARDLLGIGFDGPSGGFEVGRDAARAQLGRMANLLHVDNGSDSRF